jgi:hypothetical protein
MADDLGQLPFAIGQRCQWRALIRQHINESVTRRARSACRCDDNRG